MSSNPSPIQKASVTFDAAVSKLTQTSKDVRANLISLSERFTGEVRGRLMTLSTPLKKDNRAEKAVDKTCGQLQQFQAVATPSRSPTEAMLTAQRLKALPPVPQPKVKNTESKETWTQSMASTAIATTKARPHSLPVAEPPTTPTRAERAKSEPPVLTEAQKKEEAKKEIAVKHLTNELYTTGVKFNKDVGEVSSAFNALNEKLQAKGKKDPVLANFSQSLKQLKELDDVALKEFERINKLPDTEKQTEMFKFFNQPNGVFKSYMEAHGKFLLQMNDIKPDQMNSYKSQMGKLGIPEMSIDPSILQLRCQKIPLVATELIKQTKAGDPVPENAPKKLAMVINEQRRMNDLGQLFEQLSKSSQALDKGFKLPIAGKQVMQNLKQIAATPTHQRALKLREFIQSETFNTHIDSLEKSLRNPSTSKKLQAETKTYLAQTKEMMKAVGYGETIKDKLPASVETVFRLSA